MNDLWYLALAYAVICLGLIGYLFRLAARAQSLSQEVNLLMGILRAGEEPAGECQSETIASTGVQPGEAGSEA